MNQTLDTQDNPPESRFLQKTILVVEDEPVIGNLLPAAIKEEGHLYQSVANLADSLHALGQHRCEIVIVDLSLSGHDAVETVRQIRKSHATPILVAMEHGKEARRADALFAGADDYITKPVRSDELSARIKHALTRKKLLPNIVDKPTFEMDRLKVDRKTCRVSVDGEEVHLTPTEYRLLIVLIDNAGRIITHKQFLMEVWGKEYLDEVQYLRIYMGHLRKKLGDYTNKKKFLLTEPRVGYRLAI